LAYIGNKCIKQLGTILVFAPILREDSILILTNTSALLLGDISAAFAILAVDVTICTPDAAVDMRQHMVP